MLRASSTEVVTTVEDTGLARIIAESRLAKRGPGRALLLGISLAATSCAAPHGPRTVEVATVGCIVAHQDWPDEEVAKICGVAEAFVEPMRSVLAQSRIATIRAAMAAEARISLSRCLDEAKP